MSENEIHSEVVTFSGVCHGEMQTPRSEVQTVEKEAGRCVNVCQFSLCTQFELEISLHCLGKPPGQCFFISWGGIFQRERKNIAFDCIIFKMKNLFYKRQVTKAVVCFNTLILVWKIRCFFSVAFLPHVMVR